MPLLDLATSTLLVIVQTRLMPAIDGADLVVANATRLVQAARLLGAPRLVTEQNPKGLGPTAPELPLEGAAVLRKMAFDATKAPGFDAFAPRGRTMIVIGVEAHVCVLQTAMGSSAGASAWPSSPTRSARGGPRARPRRSAS